MSPISVGIDLGQPRIPVGGLVLSKYIVVRGDKDIKVNGLHAPSKGEVVDAIADANKVVKSFFGAPRFQAAVVVVPNSTSSDNREAVISAGRSVGFNITQLINEYVAVAAAYAHIVNPASKKSLAIVSVTGGYLDVTIISVNADLEFELFAREAHLQPIELDEAKAHESKHSGPGGLFGLVGGAVKALVVDPLDKAFDIVKNLLSNPKLSESEVDAVIFVGNASKSEKLKEAVKERFPNAAVWSPEGVDKDELAAYGAGVIAFNNRTVRVKVSGRTDLPTEDYHLGEETGDEYAGRFGEDDDGPFAPDSVSL